MSLANIFDIAGSGMAAQSLRLNTVASNIANANSVSSNTDETYRAKQPVFSEIQRRVEMGGFFEDPIGSAGNGVEVLGVIESEAPLRKQFEPNHPMADDDGYVSYPNVNIVEEMANMISASRSFQTNVEIMDTAKTMMQRVLSMGQ